MGVIETRFQFSKFDKLLTLTLSLTNDTKNFNSIVNFTLLDFIFCFLKIYGYDFNRLQKLLFIEKYLIPTREFVLNKIEELRITSYDEFILDHFASEQHLSLYKLKGNYFDSEFSLWPYPVSLTLSYYKLAIGAKFDKVRKLLKDLGINHQTAWHQAYNILKEIGVCIKMANKDFDEDWVYLVDLHMLYGFNLGVPLKREEVNERCAKWGKGKTFSNSLMTRHLDEFENIIVDILSVRKQRYRPNLDTWLNNPDNWMTAGSSRGVTVPIFDLRDVHAVESSGKKMAYALTNNVDALKDSMLSYDLKETYTTALKVEVGGKGRLIVSAPFINNVRMARLSTLIEKMCAYENVVIFQEPKDTGEMYQRGVAMLSEGFWAVPLDADKFDWNVKTDEIRRSFRAMKRTVKKFSDDLLNDLALLDLVERNYRSMLHNGDFSFRWEHGVPSGIRWTTLLDTIVSLGRALLIKSYIGKRVGRNIIVEIWSLGDDIVFWLRNRFMCLVIVDLYDQFGFPVNILKNFASNRYAEFLRNIVSREGVFGYPARKIASILFDKPGSARSDRLEKLVEIFDNINVLSTRFVPRDNVINLIKLEINARFTNALPIFKCPLALGGLFEFDFLPRTTTFQTLQYINNSRRFIYKGNLGAYGLKYSNTYNLVGNVLNEVGFKLADSLVPEGFLNMIDSTYETIDIINNLDNIYLGTNVVNKFAWIDFKIKESLNIFTDIVISHFLDLENSRNLILAIMHDSCREAELFFWHKCQRSVWHLWIKGELKIKTPLIVGFSKSQISREIKIIHDLFFTEMYNKARIHKVTVKDFRIMNHSAIRFIKNFHKKHNVLTLAY